MATRSLQKHRPQPVPKTEAPASIFTRYVGLTCGHLEREIDGLGNLIKAAQILDSVDAHDDRQQAVIFFQGFAQQSLANLQALVSELKNEATASGKGGDA